VRTQSGRGPDRGTWLHEDVALEYARWLSPAFAIWCNQRIKELLKYGFTATPEKLEEMILNPDFIIKLAEKYFDELTTVIKSLGKGKTRVNRSNKIKSG